MAAGRPSERPSPADDPKQDNHHGDNQQQMNEAAQGVGSNQPEKPEDDQDNSDGIEHDGPTFWSVRYKRQTQRIASMETLAWTFSSIRQMLRVARRASVPQRTWRAMAAPLPPHVRHAVSHGWHGLRSWLGAVLVGLLLLAPGSAALSYESRGARACAAWNENRSDKSEHPQPAEIYETWLIGYLSGIVAGSGMDFLAGSDNETVYLMVDAYCAKNQRMNLAAAGTSVARELMQQKGIVNQPTLP